MCPQALVLLAAFCFGTTGTAQALGAPGADPLTVGAARIVLGAALLAAAASRLAPGAPAIAADRTALTIAGVFVAVYQLAFFQAVHETGVAVGTVVALGSGPVFAGLITWATTRKRPTRRWAAATGLAAGGVGLLVGGDGEVVPLGVGLALVSGVGYASYTVAAKRLLDAGQAPERVMARIFSVGALLLVPVIFATGGGGLGSASGLATVLYLGVIPTAVAYVLFARGLRRLSASETATLTLAEPVTAAALGVIVLSEPSSPSTLAGAALVLGGILLLAVQPGRRPARALRDLAATPAT